MRAELQKKIDQSITMLRKAERLALAYDKQDGFFLAFSGGKDSQALYHIAQLAGVKFKAHFSPTSVDPPQVIRFIKTHYPDVEFKKLTTNIYKTAIKKNILPTMFFRWCCAEFKESSGAGKVTLTGVRKAESVRRSKRKEIEITSHKFKGNLEEFNKYHNEKTGDNFDIFETATSESITTCIKGKDSIIINPIIEWTEQDVWDFLNDVVKVEHCELYDKGYKRIGCIMCPMAQPKQKRKEAQDFPHVKAKWIESIKHMQASGKGLHCQELASLGKEEAANALFDWWISGKPWEQWFAETYKQTKIDFEL